MDLTSALGWLDSHINHEVATGAGIAAGSIDGLTLEPMRRMCAAMGDPQLAYPTLHVTGTNGKGTVVAMIESLLATSGLTVGSTTSPHISEINERIRRNGEPISDVDLAEILTELADLEIVVGERLSWFELVCAAAFGWFATESVDVAVVEVGLLGRFDATNVVESTVSVITNIGRDHTDGRPDWERRVAWEKAGIVKSGSDVVVGSMDDSLVDLVRAEQPARIFRLGHEIQLTEVRRALGGHLVDVVTPWAEHTDVFVPLHGGGQVDNAAMAIATVEAFFDRPMESDIVRLAIASTLAPARVDVVAHRPLVVIDGAHNRDAVEHLVDALEGELSVAGTRICVVGMLAGRDPLDVLEPLAALGVDVVICTTPPNERALPAGELDRAARSIGLVTQVRVEPDDAVRAALALATADDVVAICGSFTLAHAARIEVDRFLAARPRRTDED